LVSEFILSVFSKSPPCAGFFVDNDDGGASDPGTAQPQRRYPRIILPQIILRKRRT
jgi:hypothetical protein